MLHGGLDSSGGLVELPKRHGAGLDLLDQRRGVVVAGVGHERAEQRRIRGHLDRDLHEEAIPHRRRKLERLLALDSIAVGEDLQVGSGARC